MIDRNRNRIYKGIIILAVVTICTIITFMPSSEMYATGVFLQNSINWEWFLLEPAKADSNSVFGLAQFLSTLALLVVVFNVSDFRYRYRLSITRYDFRIVSIIIAAVIAVFLVLIEFWFQNSLLIFHFINSYVNLKLFVASIFLSLLIYIVIICFLQRVSLKRSNAAQFFNSTAHYIHQGNKDRLQIIAEELIPAMEKIFREASKANINTKQLSLPIEQACAHDLMLMLADRRFCNVVVDRSPSFAIESFILAGKYSNVPFAQFSRNIGEEFISNTDSAFYQEISGYYSGYFGYSKPITTAVFGNFELIERCASESTSPLDLHYSVIGTLNDVQMDGFTRAGLSFFNAYLHRINTVNHSYAFARLLSSLKSASSGLFILNNMTSGDWKAPEYSRFNGAAEFLKEAIISLSKSGIKARALRPQKQTYHDVYDALAHSIKEMIFESSNVNVASFISWQVQHNIAWNILFSFDDDYTYTVLRFKVRRLIYDEIIRNRANFVSARYLGFCLHVCGLTPGSRHEKFHRRDYALRVCVISWTKKNYKTLLDDHPKVAQACLLGSVTYDPENHRLVKTFTNATGKAPTSEILFLD